MLCPNNWVTISGFFSHDRIMEMNLIQVIKSQICQGLNFVISNLFFFLSIGGATVREDSKKIWNQSVNLQTKKIKLKQCEIVAWTVTFTNDKVDIQMRIYFCIPILLLEGANKEVRGVKATLLDIELKKCIRNFT